MSAQINGLGLFNNPYATYNPYSTGGINDDFYGQQMFQNFKQYTGRDMRTFHGIQEPQASFEKANSGESGVSKGIKLGAVAGLGTAAGVYFYGTNPVGEKALKDGFIKEFGNEYTKIQTANILKTNKLKPEIYKELLNFKEGDDISKLSKQAKAYLTKHNVPKTSEGISGFVKNISDEIHKTDINYQNQKLAGYKKLEETFKALPDKKKSTIHKFLTDNAEKFGLKGAYDAATKTNVDNLLKDKKAYSKIHSTIKTKIKTQEQSVKNASGILDDVFSLWDKDKKVFNKATTKDVTEACSKGLKNFKWKSAGKWGAIAAGVGLVLGSLFGGSDK